RDRDLRLRLELAELVPETREIAGRRPAMRRRGTGSVISGRRMTMKLAMTLVTGLYCFGSLGCKKSHVDDAEGATTGTGAADHAPATSPTQALAHKLNPHRVHEPVHRRRPEGA